MVKKTFILKLCQSPACLLLCICYIVTFPSRLPRGNVNTLCICELCHIPWGPLGGAAPQSLGFFNRHMIEKWGTPVEPGTSCFCLLQLVIEALLLAHASAPHFPCRQPLTLIRCFDLKFRFSPPSALWPKHSLLPVNGQYCFLLLIYLFVCLLISILQFIKVKVQVVHRTLMSKR